MSYEDNPEDSEPIPYPYKRIGTKTGRLSSKDILFKEQMTTFQRLADSIDSRINYSYPNNLTKTVFDVPDHINRSYRRDINCWSNGIDFSSVSPWNSAGGNLESGTLISPIHVILANHYHYPNNTLVRFITMNNQIIERVMVKGTLVQGEQVYSGIGTDIFIGTFDEPINPSLIKPMPILPKDYIIDLGQGYGLPAVIFDQEEKSLIADVLTLNDQIVYLKQYTQFPNRSRFFEQLVFGDSGNPIMLVFGTQPILLTHCLFGGAGAGPSYSYYRDAINSVLGLDGYNLEVFNFTRTPLRPPTRQPLVP